MRRIQLLSLLPVLLISYTTYVVTGCSAPGPLTGESSHLDKHVVAKFGSDYRLTAADLKYKMLHSIVVPAGGTADDTTVARFLDSVLVDTLVGLEAHEFNFDSVWVQARSHRDENYNYLVRDFWDYMVFDHIKADSLEVAQFWKDHPDEFYIPEQVNAYQILCSPDGFLHGPDSSIAKGMSRERRMELAEDLCQKLHKMLDLGEPFQNVAYAYSHDILSRQQGGYLGWTVRETYYDPFDTIAFNLPLYEYSDPYKDADGWHIIYVEGHLGPGPVPFDSAGVYDAAEEALKALKANRAIARVSDSLVKNVGYNIVYNDSLINASVNRLDDSVWAATVNGVDTIDMRDLKPLELGYCEKYFVDSTIDDIRREMIHDAADRYLLVEAARSLGLDKTPEYLSNEASRRHLKSKALILGKIKGTQWTPSMDSVRAYYDQNITEFIPVHHLDVEMLTMTDSALASFLQEQAEVGHEMKDLADYWTNEMAMDVRYTDLGIIDSGTVDDRIYRAAEATRKYRVSYLIPTDSGYSFIRVKNRRETIPLPTAVPLIRDKLQKIHLRDKWNAFRDSLYTKYEVQFPERMMSVQLPPRGERPGAP